MKRTAVCGTAILLLALSQGHLLAGQNKKTSAQTDPIMKALQGGVDKIPGQANLQAPALQRRNPRYHVEAGDIIILNFPYTPKFNQTVTVNPDGYISLQNAGDVHVEGETLPQIKVDVAKAYGAILRSPDVSVALKQFENPYFLALGQVTHPGKYNLEGDTTVAEAVAMAGGFTPKAKHSDVLLFRRVSENWVSATKINLKHMLRSGNLAEDPHLHPGDMVYVPQNEISKIKPFLPWPSLSYYIR